MATPTPLSVSNVALPNLADSGNVAVTIPTGANACVIGGTYYVGDSSVITSITGSVFSSTTNGGLRVNNPTGGSYMGNYAQAFKVTAVGSQTVRVQKTGNYSEGPTCQIGWFTVDDPDNFVPSGGFTVVQQTGSPQALAATVNSNTTDYVFGMFGTDGSSADPSAPTGTTLRGTMQTTQFDKSIAFSVNSPGASTTTVTAGSRDFPSLFLVSLRGSSGPTPTNYTLTCDVGAYSLTGIAALLRRGYSLVASTGSYALTGQDAVLRRGYSLSADTGAYALTGQNAALRRGYSLACDVGAYSLTGQDATLTYSAGGTAYTLTCDVGSYAITGYDANLVYTPGAANYSLVCDTGVYALTGQNAVTTLGRRMVADVGAYALTGQAANLIYGRRLVCDTGSYSLTGQDANLVYTTTGPIAYSLTCETGAYVLSGSDATLIGPKAEQEPEVIPTYVVGKKTKPKERKLMGGPRWQRHELGDLSNLITGRPYEEAEREAEKQAQDAIAKASQQQEIAEITSTAQALELLANNEALEAQALEAAILAEQQELEDAQIMAIIAELL